MLICVTVLILNTQNNVDEPGPQLVVEPQPQGLFPLSDFGNSQHIQMIFVDHADQIVRSSTIIIMGIKLWGLVMGGGGSYIPNSK